MDIFKRVPDKWAGNEWFFSLRVGLWVGIVYAQPDSLQSLFISLTPNQCDMDRCLCIASDL